jgi:threonine/homoserine/homoserine lactone efflux protein
MLFLFQGKNGPAARAVIGVLLIVVGFAVHGEAILVAIGGVLLLWAGVLALRADRSSRHTEATSGSQLS